MSIGLLPSFITWLPASLSLPSLSTPSLSLFLPLSLSLSLILFPRYILIRTPVPPAPIVSLSSLWSTALRHDDAVFREHTTHKNAGLYPSFSRNCPEIHLVKSNLRRRGGGRVEILGNRLSVDYSNTCFA